jgi:hypothetical protein
MEITSFKPSKDRKTLEVTISDAASVTSLLLFTNKTYKDYNNAIDLTSKLSGLSTENITITLGDLKQSYLDGLYFIQVEDPDEICTSITSDTTRYKECALEKIMQIDNCEECLAEASGNILVVEASLTGLEIAVKHGFVEQAFNIVKALDKLCGTNCNTCGSYDNVATKNYFNTDSNG